MSSITRVYYDKIDNVTFHVSSSCIDKWFQVNRSCPEHPGDWFVPAELGGV